MTEHNTPSTAREYTPRTRIIRDVYELHCDRCGRFTTNSWTYDRYQPDPWNGPRITRLCDRCAVADPSNTGSKP